MLWIIAAKGLDSITKTSLLVGIVLGMLTIGTITWGVVWRAEKAFWRRLDLEIDGKLEPVKQAQETVAKDLGELVAWRADVDYQFNPNGGLSLVDKINRIEALLTRED